MVNGKADHKYNKVRKVYVQPNSNYWKIIHGDNNRL